MSDIYGIGAAMLGALRQYTETHRRTGRSTTLLKLVRDDDVIIFHDEGHKKAFQRMMDCSGRNPEKVKMVVCRNLSFHSIFNQMRGTPKGRVWFDHDFIERLFETSTRSLCEDISKLSEDLSGYGHAHLVTRDEAERRGTFKPSSRPTSRPPKRR